MLTKTWIPYSYNSKFKPDLSMKNYFLGPQLPTNSDTLFSGRASKGPGVWMLRNSCRVAWEGCVCVCRGPGEGPAQGVKRIVGETTAAGRSPCDRCTPPSLSTTTTSGTSQCHHPFGLTPPLGGLSQLQWLQWWGASPNGGRLHMFVSVCLCTAQNDWQTSMCCGRGLTVFTKLSRKTSWNSESPYIHHKTNMSTYMDLACT